MKSAKIAILQNFRISERGRNWVLPLSSDPYSIVYLRYLIERVASPSASPPEPPVTLRLRLRFQAARLRLADGPCLRGPELVRSLCLLDSSPEGPARIHGRLRAPSSLLYALFSLRCQPGLVDPPPPSLHSGLLHLGAFITPLLYSGGLSSSVSQPPIGRRPPPFGPV